MRLFLTVDGVLKDEIAGAGESSRELDLQWIVSLGSAARLLTPSKD